MFTSFLTQLMGAFLVWAFKGFKGEFKEEMTSPEEQSWKYYRNSLISLGVVAIIYLAITGVLFT